MNWRSSQHPGNRRSKRALLSAVSTPERSPGAKNCRKISSEFQGPGTEDEVLRPRVGAGVRKSLGMQFQKNVALRQEQPAVAIRKNEDSLLNINDIIDPELQSTLFDKLSQASRRNASLLSAILIFVSTGTENEDFVMNI